MRTYAIHNVLVAQRDAPGKERVQRLALLLTAACVWLANSMHSRPMDESGHRKLMALTLPHQPKSTLNLNTIAYPTTLDIDDENEDETHPCFIHGAIFLRKIYLPPTVVAPRMARCNFGFFSPVESKFIFGMTEDDLKHKFNNLGFCRKEDLPVMRSRVTNKSWRTEKFYNWEEDGAQLPNTFSLGAQGIEIPQTVDYASDGGMDGNNDDPMDVDGTLDEQLTVLWRQYLLDVMLKCPNPKGGLKSYCRLNKTQRQKRSHLLFGHRQNLAEIFYKCGWKIGTAQTFETVFDKHFPPKGHLHVEGTGQGYGASSYYRQWKQLIEMMPDKDADTIRESMKTKFDELSWVPHSEAGKFWQSKSTNDKLKYAVLPITASGPVPLILVKNGIVWNEIGLEEPETDSEEDE